MNTKAVRTAPRSPWQNAYVERVIGSIRRECLDHVIVMNAAGLHRVLSERTSRTTCGREPILRLTRTLRTRARSHHRPPVMSSPFQKSAVCTTVTTASPRRHCVAFHRQLSVLGPFNTSVFRCTRDIRDLESMTGCTARTYTRVGGFGLECPILISTFQ